MLNKRTQILFDQDMWQKLTSLAKAKNTSVSQLIRKAIEDKYAEALELAERKRILEDIERIRPAPFKGKINYKELINYGRK